jgi:hypothetical protein
MATITFDTLKFARRLKDAGVEESQAEAEAEALAEALSEALESQLATKSDITRLEGRIVLLQWMLGFLLAGNLTMLLKLFT